MLKLLDGITRLLAAFARATYFVTCMFALAGAGYALSVGFPPNLIAFLVICVYGIPAGRALLRLARGSGLIPQPRLQERWDVAVVMSATSVLGNFLAVNLIIALYQIISLRRDGDGAAALVVLIMILFAITLLCGEIVLIGRNRPAPRTV